MKYRIKEKVWLDKEDAEVRHQYFVQEKRWFGWHTMTKLFPCGDNCVSSKPIVFNEFSEAKSYKEKLENNYAAKPFTRYYF